MNRLASCFLKIAFTLTAVLLSASAAESNPQPAVRDLNTPRSFPEIKSRAEWTVRAREIRAQALISCGLWPLPEKTPLLPHIFDKIERDGYSVEKVYFQTYPGFYLAGNLYRPLGRGPGPFPGVLNPHGHWAEGRMADTKDGSIAARCISFARQGMIAFCYDMAGYNDTRFPDAPVGKTFYEPHRMFGTNQTDLLWNISLMGLQTWNSIRALDFLASLPDVDTKRLGCTGASGGGTQTFMLGAIDDRLAAQAPIVMVSHTMQGGCSCENSPGLRVEYSNMEIAAAAVPRPQILVAATGDWTKATLEVEGPAIRKIYELFKSQDRLRYVRFDYGHNYNQTTREAVYAWFGQWLLHHPDPASLKEQPYHKEPDADLRVFPDHKPPTDALTKDEFTQSLKLAHRRQWARLVPHTRSALDGFKKEVLPAWRRTLLLDWPANSGTARRISGSSGESCDIERYEVAPSSSGSKLTAVHLSPRIKPSGRTNKRLVIVLANAEAGATDYEQGGKPRGLAGKLVDRGYEVWGVESFSTGKPQDQFANFFSTYNRTHLQERVRDLVAVCAQARVLAARKGVRVVLCGSGRAGLWSLLAAPAADAVIADCDSVDARQDEPLLETDLFCPGIRNIGTFEGGVMLAAPHPALLHNVGEKFPADGVSAAFRAAGRESNLRVEARNLNDGDILEWIARLK